MLPERARQTRGRGEGVRRHSDRFSMGNHGRAYLFLFSVQTSAEALFHRELGSFKAVRRSSRSTDPPRHARTSPSIDTLTPRMSHRWSTSPTTRERAETARWRRLTVALALTLEDDVRCMLRWMHAQDWPNDAG